MEGRDGGVRVGRHVLTNLRDTRYVITLHGAPEIGIRGFMSQEGNDMDISIWRCVGSLGSLVSAASITQNDAE